MPLKRGLLGIEGLDRQEIQSILDRAHDFQPAKDTDDFKRLVYRRHSGACRGKQHNRTEICERDRG